MPTDDVLDAYDPERFRTAGHAVVDLLADHLAKMARREGPVLPWRLPDDAARAWALPADGGADPLATLARVIAESNHLHHPRYVGHQVTAPLPEAALCDLVSSLLNNGNAVYEMGPVAAPMERALTRFLTAALGWPATADGSFTSGGSLGNLTCLLAARRAAEKPDDPRPLAVLVTKECHYSIDRALKIMGLGDGGAELVAVDAKHRLDPAALPGALAAAEARGRRVIAVVASAGSTSTGAHDPLGAVADFCEPRGLWFHVDGAHGASGVLSPTLRPRLAGIERADSVVWDAHKLMLMPALLTAILFRDGRRSHATFSQEAHYLFDERGEAHTALPGEGRSPLLNWWDHGRRTVECTKTMMALKLWVTLAARGPGFFARYLDRMHALSAWFAARVAADPRYELALEPDSNIVCFRLAGAPDARQEAARKAMLASGRFYLVQTRLPRGVFLRVTIINPLTTEDDLTELLAALA